MRRTFCLTLALSLLTVCGLGCTKLVPVEGSVLDERKASVITFTDGSSIRGKIDIDEDVVVTKGGVVYAGIIYDLTDEEIVLDECRYLHAHEGYDAGRSRLAEARVDVQQELMSFEFRRDEIERVERVRVDAMKTATRTAFWTLSGVVSVFLLQEHS